MTDGLPAGEERGQDEEFACISHTLTHIHTQTNTRTHAASKRRFATASRVLTAVSPDDHDRLMDGRASKKGEARTWYGERRGSGYEYEEKMGESSRLAHHGTEQHHRQQQGVSATAADSASPAAGNIYEHTHTTD